MSMDAAVQSGSLRCTVHGVPVDVRKTDLGLNSVLLRTGRPPPLGSLLEVTLHHGSDCEARLDGRVTRIERPERMGGPRGFEVEFTHVDAAQTQRLYAILARLRDQSERLMSGAQAHALARLEEELVRVRSVTPHEVLGVRSTTTGGELERAFLARVRQYHPHRFARFRSARMTELATQVFVEIQRAYGTMSRAKSDRPARESLG